VAVLSPASDDKLHLSALLEPKIQSLAAKIEGDIKRASFSGLKLD
jgi:hypothetical protein